MSTAYVVAAVRTAGGRKAGRLSGWHPADLAGKVERRNERFGLQAMCEGGGLANVTILERR